MADQKWNLGDIRPADHTRRPRRAKVTVPPAASRPQASRVDVTDMHTEEVANPAPRRRRRTGGRNKLFLLGLLALFLIGLGIATTLIFRGAEVTVYPKTREVHVDATLTASQNPIGEALGYELLSLEESGERVVPATGEEPAEERATGEIIIYNLYSKDPQRLIKNTRFVSSDGHIFRISDSVVVPGYTGSDTEKAPGTAKATVFADAPGEEYNIASSKFTIPGLSGSAQFDQMYAQSDTPMSGGFVGTRLIVEDSELQAGQAAIQEELTNRLRDRLAKERPTGFEVYDAAAQIHFTTLPSTDAGKGQATIREQATLEIPIFAKADFARYIAQSTVPGYEGEDIRIENPQELTFSYTTYATTSEEADPEKPLNADSIEFTLAGDVLLVWDFDENKLREDLAGVSKTALPSILTGYPAIQNVDTVIRPFWKQSFPASADDIRIVEILNKDAAQ